MDIQPPWHAIGWTQKLFGFYTACKVLWMLFFFNSAKHSLKVCKVITPGKCLDVQLPMQFLLKVNGSQTPFLPSKVSPWEMISMPFLQHLSKKFQNVLKVSGLHFSNQRHANEKVFVTKNKCKVFSERFGSMYHVRSILRGESLMTLFFLPFFIKIYIENM